MHRKALVSITGGLCSLGSIEIVAVHNKHAHCTLMYGTGAISGCIVEREIEVGRPSSPNHRSPCFGVEMLGAFLGLRFEYSHSVSEPETSEKLEVASLCAHRCPHDWTGRIQYPETMSQTERPAYLVRRVVTYRRLCCNFKYLSFAETVVSLSAFCTRFIAQAASTADSKLVLLP
jgi:hypothetical protein